jgi:hypothetical protein
MDQGRPRSGAGHFSEEDWLDFARGVSGEAAAEMERHLSACASCAAAAGFWQETLGAARRLTAHPGADAAARQAAAVFALAGPRRRGLAARAREAATLVFDSLRQPVPAGVRAVGPSARHLQFQAGPYAIRLRVESAGDTDRLSIVGQVTDDTNPTRSLGDLAVLALRGKDTVDRTLTNTLGEFHFEPEAADNLRLSVGVPDRGPLTVGLLVRTRSGRADARAHGSPGRRTTPRTGPKRPGR